MASWGMVLIVLLMENVLHRNKAPTEEGADHVDNPTPSPTPSAAEGGTNHIDNSSPSPTPSTAEESINHINSPLPSIATISTVSTPRTSVTADVHDCLR